MIYASHDGRREGDSAPTGGLGERLEADVPTHFDDGADHTESALIEIERVGAEAGCLSHRSPAPAVATTARYRSGTMGSKTVTNSSCVMIRSSESCLRRGGSRMSPQGLKANGG
jgi:hypothetical protein